MGAQANEVDEGSGEKGACEHAQMVGMDDVPEVVWNGGVGK